MSSGALILKYAVVVLLFGVGFLALVDGEAYDGYVVIDGWTARIFGAALMIGSVILGFTSNKSTNHNAKNRLPPDFG